MVEGVVDEETIGEIEEAEECAVVVDGVAVEEEEAAAVEIVQELLERLEVCNYLLSPEAIFESPIDYPYATVRSLECLHS